MRISSLGFAARRVDSNSRNVFTASDNTACFQYLPIGIVHQAGTMPRVKLFFVHAAVTGSTVDRWGLGVVQEIDSAAMHVFARWQHLDLDLDATDLRLSRGQQQRRLKFVNKNFGKSFGTSLEGLDIFQVGGVIFF